MRPSARIDASSSLHVTCDSGSHRATSGITSEEACHLAEVAQRPFAQQAQLQQSHRSSQGDNEQLVQGAAFDPCLQLHGWECQPNQQQQQHRQMLSQPYPHPQQQQLMSTSAGMGVSNARHPLQLLRALSAAAELPDSSKSAAAEITPQQQLAHPSQQKEEPQLQSGCSMSVAEVSIQIQQPQQQQCEPWGRESATQHNPFLHAMQQQGTPSAATTASNVSVFASAAGEGGSIGNRSSSAGGSSGGSSGGGAGLASVIGRTVTGELPAIPPRYGSLQAAATAASGLAQQQSLSTHHIADVPADGSVAAADAAASCPGLAAGPAAGVEQHHPQQQKQQQQQQPPQQQPQQHQQHEQFVLRHTRQITCKTYLKRLNVTQYMSDNLLPTMEGSLRVSSQKAQPATAHLQGSSKGHLHRHNALHRSKSAAAASDDEYDPHGRSTAAGAAAAGDHKHTSGSCSGSGQRNYQMMFKVQIKLVDSAGQVWPVTYEGALCAGQRHLRLTCGWSEFIKAKKIGIGDAITFEQRDGNKTVLAVAIQKAGQQAEEMWGGPLPQDEQIKVLVGSLRSNSAAAAKGSADCGKSSYVVAASPNAVAPAAGGRGGRQAGQHRQVVPGPGSAGRQQLKCGSVQAKRTKKRRQRDDTDDDDDDVDRDFSRSHDEAASSGSTAVTDGTAGTNSGSRINSTATAATFAPTVKGFQALRVDSAPGRLGQSGSLAAATAAAIAAVDAGLADGPAEGSDGSVPRSSSEGPWQQQQQQHGALLHKQLSPAVGAPAGGLGPSRYAQETPGYASQAAQLHFQRRLRQRQQHDDQLQSSGPGATDQTGEQAGGANKYTQMAAAIAGNRRLAEWAAVNRLAATDAVQSHQLLLQQPQQLVHEEQHQQQQQYQQQLYSSGSAPLGSGPTYSQHKGSARGPSPIPGSFRHVGWQVSTGFTGGPSSLPIIGRSGDVYTSQQDLYGDLQPRPSIGPAAGGSALEGTAPVPVLSRQESMLSQQRPKLSQQAAMLSQQQSVGGRDSLVPQDLAAYGSGVHNSGEYQPALGTQYPPNREGRSPSDLVPDETSAAHRSSIMDAASAVARTLMMGPSRPQQQQAGGHLYPSAAQLSRAYSLQQQQQQMSQPMLVDSGGSWPVLGSGWQQQQLDRPSYLVKTEQVLHPESAWDPHMLHTPLPTAAKQQQLASPYEQVQTQQLLQQARPQSSKLQRYQHLVGIPSYEQVHQQADVAPYERVQSQQHWQGRGEENPIATADVVAHAAPQHRLQNEQSQGQLLESAGMSAEFDSIGAMESVELVDTLLQLLGNEQADQQQQVAAAGAAVAPLQQQVQLQDRQVAVSEAGHQTNHVLQPQSLYQQTMPPHLQAPQLDPTPGNSSLLQQWLQQPSHKSQLVPPTLLPLEAVMHPQLQPGAG